MHANQYTKITKNRECTIRELVQMGVPFEKIKKDLRLSDYVMKLLYFKYSKGTSLGHKWEAYYETEDQMLNKLIYEYNSLSDDEKYIYGKTGASSY